MTTTNKMVAIGLVAAIIGFGLGLLLGWGIRGSYPPGAKPVKVKRDGDSVIVKVQVEDVPAGHKVELKSTDPHVVIFGIDDTDKAQTYPLPDTERGELEKLLKPGAAAARDVKLKLYNHETNPIKPGAKVDVTVILWATISPDGGNGRTIHLPLIGTTPYETPITVD